MGIGGNIYNTDNSNLKMESDEGWMVDPKDWIMRTQLRSFDYIKYCLYLSVIMAIVFQLEFNGFEIHGIDDN